MNEDVGQSQQSEASPFDTYEKLRTAVMELLKQGLPGADQLLIAIDKIQSKNVMEATQGGQQGVVSPQANSQYGQAPTQ
jgi:hypothetical protein